MYDEDGAEYVENTVGPRLPTPKKDFHSVTPYPNNPADVDPAVWDKKNIDATLYETARAEDAYSLALLKFFNGPVVIQSIYKYIQIDADVFKYGIYVLQQKRVLDIYSFDSRAAQIPMKISLDEEILVVERGTFVLEKHVSNPTNADRVLLEVHSYGDGNYSFEFIGVSYEVVNEFVQLVTDAAEKNNFYRGRVFTNKGDFVNVGDMTFDNIILPEKIKNEIKENVFDFIKFKIPLLEKHGLPTKRGLIFEGQPGVGKTFTSKAIAATAGVSFMIVTGVQRVSTIREIYKFARKITPVIILFEDIDIYLFDRDSGDDKLSVLLNEMDGIEENKKLITILTTNKIGVLDNAIKDRPGRFDRILHFGVPDETISKHMLQLFSKKFDTTEVDFDQVVQKLKDRKYTGAHYKEIVITACMRAVTKGNDEIKLSTQNLLDAAEVLHKSSSVVRKRKAGFKPENKDQCVKRLPGFRKE